MDGPFVSSVPSGRYCPTIASTTPIRQPVPAATPTPSTSDPSDESSGSRRFRRGRKERAREAEERNLPEEVRLANEARRIALRDAHEAREKAKRESQELVRNQLAAMRARQGTVQSWALAHRQPPPFPSARGYGYGHVQPRPAPGAYYYGHPPPPQGTWGYGPYGLAPGRR